MTHSSLPASWKAETPSHFFLPSKLYRDKATSTTSSFIGDFDIQYLLRRNGSLAVKVYNQTNDRYFTRSSLNTQGVGLILRKDFDGLGDLLRRRRK